jgi:hypothetical protein
VGKLLIMPVVPDAQRPPRNRVSDPRYMEGQRLLVEALRYLVKNDPVQNRLAAEFISEHVRTNFRMSDSPLPQMEPSH